MSAENCKQTEKEAVPAPVQDNVLIELLDQGQDLTAFVATRDGRILDAHLWMNWIYEGGQITGQTDEDIPRLYIRRPGKTECDEPTGPIRWPVIEQAHVTATTVEAARKEHAANRSAAA